MAKTWDLPGPVSTEWRMAPRLLHRGEVAEALGVDVSTLSRWAKSGVGPRCIKLGEGSIRYDVTDVVEFIESRKTA